MASIQAESTSAPSMTRKGSGPRPPRTSTGSGAGTVCSTTRPPFTAGSPAAAEHLLQRARPARRARARQAARARSTTAPVTDTVRAFTYAELRDQVAQLRRAPSAAQGVEKGDRVIIYMPMVPEAVFAMLACARIGAVHSVVFGGFAPRELAKRIDDARPKLILSASCGIEVGPGDPVQAAARQAIDDGRRTSRSAA